MLTNFSFFVLPFDLNFKLLLLAKQLNIAKWAIEFFKRSKVGNHIPTRRGLLKSKFRGKMFELEFYNKLQKKETFELECKI